MSRLLALAEVRALVKERIGDWCSPMVMACFRLGCRRDEVGWGSKSLVHPLERIGQLLSEGYIAREA